MRAFHAPLLLVCVAVLTSLFKVSAATPLNERAACATLQSRVSHVMELPRSGPPGEGWFCDFSALGDAQWFVVALRSHRSCVGTCSNLIGWYAVDRQTGAVHVFDIGDLRVGAPIGKP